MSWFIVSKAFCKSMRIIPVSRPESKPVNILFVKYESEVSVEWFLRNQIDIYRECYYLLNIPWFGRVSLSQKF